MKKFLHISTLILLITTLLVCPIFTVSAADVYASYWSMPSYTYSFGSSSGLPAPFDFVGQGHYFGFSADGNVAYCVDRTSQVPEGVQVEMGSDWDGFSSSTKRNVALILLYGYDGTSRYGYSADTERVATQMAIWAATHAILGSSYEGVYRENAISSGLRNDVLSVYDRIISQLKSHYTIPSFASSSSSGARTYTAGYDASTKLHTITITDSNNVHSFYNVVSRLRGMGYGVSVSGNRITITSSTPFNGSSTISTTRTSNTSVNSLLIRDISYLAGSNVQAKVMVTGVRHAPEVVSGYFRLRSGEGSIEIQKTDSETADAVEGAVFEIFDIQGVSLGTITTDEYGHARKDSLVYGEYTLKEVEPAFGYQPNENVYDVVVNESLVTIDIENEYMLGRLHLTKLSSFDAKILPNAVYGLYRTDDDYLVEELTTDEKGTALSEFVRFGEYYLKELISPKRYHIDLNSYLITLGEVHGSTTDFEALDAPIIGEFSVIFLPENNPKLVVVDILGVPHTGVDYEMNEDIVFSYPKLPTNISSIDDTINTLNNNTILLSYEKKDDDKGDGNDIEKVLMIPWYILVVILLIPVSIVLILILQNKHRRNRYR